MMEPTFTRLSTPNKKALLTSAVNHNQSFTTVINEVVEAWRKGKDFDLKIAEPTQLTESNKQRLKDMKKSRPLLVKKKVKK